MEDRTTEYEFINELIKCESHNERISVWETFSALRKFPSKKAAIIALGFIEGINFGAVLIQLESPKFLADIEAQRNEAQMDQFYTYPLTVGTQGSIGAVGIDKRLEVTIFEIVPLADIGYKLDLLGDDGIHYYSYVKTLEAK